jgi:hypothetical protein
MVTFFLFCAAPIADCAELRLGRKSSDKVTQIVCGGTSAAKPVTARVRRSVPTSKLPQYERQNFLLAP